jgi:hypothetical protein
MAHQEARGLITMNARTDFPLGIVHGLANETYHAGPGMSNSGLALMAKSPAHYYGLKMAPSRPSPVETAAQLAGTLAHCAILEPGEFDKRYVVGPPGRRGTKIWDAFEASLTAGQIGIKPDDRDLAFAQAAAVRALPDVAALLAVGHPEVSAYWIDDVTGELCRCRPDWVHPVNDDAVILLDVKTYSDASPREFARQVARMGYDVQDAFYTDGYAIASGKKVLGFVFAAVETAYPHGACACMLDDPGRDVGRAKYRQRLDRYAACKRSNSWPGYSSAVELISLPAWAAAPVTEQATEESPA